MARGRDRIFTKIDVILLWEAAFLHKSRGIPEPGLFFHHRDVAVHQTAATTALYDYDKEARSRWTPDT
jgi:hypothetical protein